MREQDLELSRLQQVYSLFTGEHRLESHDTGAISKMKSEIDQYKQKSCATEMKMQLLKGAIIAILIDIVDLLANLESYNAKRGDMRNMIGDVRGDIYELKAKKEAILAQMKAEYGDDWEKLLNENGK